MKLNLLLVGSIWLTSFPAFSQSNNVVRYTDATFSFAKYEGSLALHYNHTWKFGKAKKVGLGLGGRITSYHGVNQYYITAPAELTSESTSPLVIFKENIPENIDSLLVKSSLLTAINVSINIHYQVTPKLMAGFNIDAIGFSFGNTVQGNYINGYTGSITQGKPTGFNVLLISDNDRGSLNSELFARYQLTNKWGVKLGVTFLFTEYTTDTQIQTYPKANDRFRNKSLMVGLGASYKF
jgi:long-subunit fatty acid transport protein